jgi:hypothetical protein
MAEASSRAEAMYGAAEQLLPGALADEVWTPSAEEGAGHLSRAVDWYSGQQDLTLPRGGYRMLRSARFQSRSDPAT